MPAAACCSSHSRAYRAEVPESAASSPRADVARLVDARVEAEPPSQLDGEQLQGGHQGGEEALRERLAGVGVRCLVGLPGVRARRFGGGIDGGIESLRVSRCPVRSRARAGPAPGERPGALGHRRRDLRHGEVAALLEALEDR